MQWCFRLKTKTPYIFQINPSTSSNYIHGIRELNYLCDFSIKINNSTIDCTVTIKNQRGVEQIFTVTTKTIINIKNSDISMITFSDSNSYYITISRIYKEINPDVVYEPEFKFIE